MENIHLRLANRMLSELESVKDDSEVTIIHEESVKQVMKAFKKPMAQEEESSVFTFLATHLKKCSKQCQTEIQNEVMKKPDCSDLYKLR